MYQVKAKGALLLGGTADTITGSVQQATLLENRRRNWRVNLSKDFKNHKKAGASNF